MQTLKKIISKYMYQRTGFLVTVILIIGAAYGSDNDLKEK